MNVLERLPSWMLLAGPWGLAVWQWVGLATSLVVAILGARVATYVVVKLAGYFSTRTTTSFDDQLVAQLRSPLRALGTIAILRLAIRLLDLPAGAEDVATDILLACFAIALVWGTLRAIDVSVTRMTTAAWAVERPASRALLSLVGRVVKVLVLVIAGIGFLSGLGLPVASLLAGLGIGGIALAFGAQKTVENLFGAVAIGVDQPLREGDFVRVEGDVLGTVETVGLRSTRIRTLDRTIVSLPNGKLADMRVESFALRDRCRLAATIGLVYGTTAEQLRTILAGLERVLRQHPGIWPDDVVVRFVAFGSSSLDVEVMAWFTTSDWSQFRTWRQEVLIAFMEVIERAGSSFAFPTRTIHVAPTDQGSMPKNRSI